MPMMEKIVQTAKHTVNAKVLMPSAMPRPSGAGSRTVIDRCIVSCSRSPVPWQPRRNVGEVPGRQLDLDQVRDCGTTNLRSVVHICEQPLTHLWTLLMSI